MLISIGLKVFGYLIAALGTYLYAKNQVLPKKRLIAFCFGMNVVLHLPSLFVIYVRTGMDTSAYLNQAGQWLSGQSDYRGLVTRQGPCFYPAGHLWFYSYWYTLYTQTDKAEYYLKIFHIMVHSVANSILGLLAYNYYQRPRRPEDGN